MVAPTYLLATPTPKLRITDCRFGSGEGAGPLLREQEKAAKERGATATEQRFWLLVLGKAHMGMAACMTLY